MNDGRNDEARPGAGGGPGARDLDARGRAAGAALLASVDEVPVPLASTGSDGPGDVQALRAGPRRAPVLAAAAVLVLALVGVVALVVRDDGEGGEGMALGSGGAPRLVLGEPVAGLEPAGAFDLPLEASSPRDPDARGAGVLAERLDEVEQRMEAIQARLTELVVELPAAAGDPAVLARLEAEQRGLTAELEGLLEEAFELRSELATAERSGDGRPDEHEPLPMRLYGDPAADQPFADADLAVLAARGAPDRWLVADSDGVGAVEPLGAGGRAGLYGDFEAGRSTRPAVAVDVGDGWTVIAASAGLDRDELVALAGQLTVEDGRPGELTDLPRSLVPVADTTWQPSTTDPLATRPGGLVGYESEAGDAFVVGAVAADRDDLLASLWTEPAVEPVEVRGSRGWRAPAGAGVLLLWEEAPGVVGTVETTLEGADLEAALAALRPPTEEEWSALPRSALAGGGMATDPAAQAAVSSETGDGTPWTAALLEDGGLCLEVVFDDRSSSSCSARSDGEDLVAEATELPGGTIVVYGATPLGPEGVRIVVEGTDQGFSTANPEAGGSVFGDALDDTGEVVPEVVVVEDLATGEVLARAEVRVSTLAVSGG